MSGFFFGAAVFCTLYFLVILLYAGPKASFLVFWAAAALFCVLCICIFNGDAPGILPKLRLPVLIAVVIGAAVFLWTEAGILYHMNQEADQDLPYIIVLGAQVKGTKVSKSLQKRLDAAIEYLQENPGTLVIVSGGQGSGEDITEAEAMENYLIDRGIDARRIYSENRSTSTRENLEYSFEIIGDKTTPAAVVTNGFHIYRSLQIGKDIGCTNLQGIGAKGDSILQLNYMVREFFAVWKERLLA